MISSTVQYRFAVFYRFMITFLLGYICTSLLTHNLTVLLHSLLPKAEAIYLAAFISILFFVGFVITSFCICSLRKLSVMSTGLLAVLYGTYRILG